MLVHGASLFELAIQSTLQIVSDTDKTDTTHGKGFPKFPVMILSRFVGELQKDDNGTEWKVESVQDRG